MNRHPRQPIQVEWATDDDIFIRHVTVADADTLLPQHAHEIGHHTLLAAGAVRVWKDGVLIHERLDAPAILYIEAKAKHAFGILEPNTVLACIHNLHGKEAVSVLERYDLVD